MTAGEVMMMTMDGKVMKRHQLLPRDLQVIACVCDLLNDIISTSKQAEMTLPPSRETVEGTVEGTRTGGESFVRMSLMTLPRMTSKRFLNHSARLRTSTIRGRGSASLRSPQMKKPRNVSLASTARKSTVRRFK